MPLPIQAIFTDIGGVLLTNGWDRTARALAVEKFELDAAEVDQRHHLVFDTYEHGKITLDEYLDQTIFYEPRRFSRDDFKDFMFEQSQPYPDTLQLFRELKRKGLKIAALSNEGRELSEYRIRAFGLGEFIDFFVVSSFVRLRKPDPDIFRLALDLSRTLPEQTAYVEDRALFVDVAARLGMRSIHHTGVENTRRALREFGVS